MSDKSALELDQVLAHHLTNERGHTLETIFLIAEMETRQTFVELGFSSMWEYLRRMHKQSDTMIHYRLRCARAITRFPQCIEPLRDGSLCVTTLAELTKIMNESNCDEVLAQALGKSVSDARKMVAKEKPKAVPKDVTRSLVSIQVPEPVAEATASIAVPSIAAEHPVHTEVLTETLSRVHMTVNQEYVDLLKEMRGELSHKMPGAADFEILIECMRIARKTLKKRKGIVDRPRADRVADDGTITQSVKRIVEQRDQGKCQWRSEDGGICGSTYRLEFHHKQDRAKGGEGTPENVIQLCEKHHLLATEIAWGDDYIEQFRKRTREPAPETLQSQLDFT